MSSSQKSTASRKPRNKSDGGSGQGESIGSKTGMGIEAGFVNGYALLIGVGECSYSQWSLPVTVRDVEALRKILVDPSLSAYPNDEQHIRILTDKMATGVNILAALDDLAEIVAKDPEATVTICYTGHGWLQGDRYYLIPHDVVPHELTKTAVPAEAFIERLRRIRARRLVVMLDTCHAEGMAEAKSAVPFMPKGFSSEVLPESLMAELGQGEGRAVFQSCRRKQKSWILEDDSLSIFTHHLIEALKGEGSGPEDRFVMVSNLMNYVSREVEETARGMGFDQIPFFKFEAEDFPVAMLRGGAGAVDEQPSKEKPAREASSSDSTISSGRDTFVAGSVGSIQTGSSS